MDPYKAPPGAKHDGTDEERAAWRAWHQSTQAARDKQHNDFYNGAVFWLVISFVVLLIVPLVAILIHDISKRL